MAAKRYLGPHDYDAAFNLTVAVRLYRWAKADAARCRAAHGESSITALYADGQAGGMRSTLEAITTNMKTCPLP